MQHFSGIPCGVQCFPPSPIPNLCLGIGTNDHNIFFQSGELPQILRNQHTPLLIWCQNTSSRKEPPPKLSALGFTKDTKVAPIAYMAQIESIYAAGAKDQYIVDTAGGSKDDSFDAYHPALWFGDSATEGNGTVSFPDENGTKVAVHTADDSSETAPKVLALHKNGFFPNIETDELVIDAHTVKNIDKALLETLVFAASKYQESNYTADSWAAFKKAFDAAKKVLDSDTATQQQVNDAYTALRTAINGLVNATAKPSKDKLKAAVDAAAKLKESDYTADSWAAFVKALDAAKAVLANDNATQEEINNATGALFKAEEALVKKAGTPTKPGKPSQPGPRRSPVRRAPTVARTAAMPASPRRVPLSLASRA